jgi:hypothetical protein
MDATWKFLDIYKEFITNGFDLFSFILVTPEIIHAVAPAVERKAGWIYAIVFLVLLIGVNVLVFFITLRIWTLADQFGWFSRRVIRFSVVIGMFLSLGAFQYSVVNSLDYVQRTGAWIKGHAFVIGLLLFFLARLFAFTMAAHERFG